jgi:hypothetical protein
MCMNDTMHQHRIDTMVLHQVFASLKYGMQCLRKHIRVYQEHLGLTFPSSVARWESQKSGIQISKSGKFRNFFLEIRKKSRKVFESQYYLFKVLFFNLMINSANLHVQIIYFNKKNKINIKT